LRGKSQQAILEFLSQAFVKVTLYKVNIFEVGAELVSSQTALYYLHTVCKISLSPTGKCVCCVIAGWKSGKAVKTVNPKLIALLLRSLTELLKRRKIGDQGSSPADTEFIIGTERQWRSLWVPSEPLQNVEEPLL
jgi:hypothetical protein